MLNKDPNIVPEAAPLIILYIKPAIFMSNNGEDTKYTRHIYIRLYFLINVDKWKFHKIAWCEEVLKLVDIATKNVGENDLNPRMKYIMLRLEK